MAKTICDRCGKAITGPVKTLEGKHYDEACYKVVYNEAFEKYVEAKYPTAEKKLTGTITYLNMVNNSLDHLEDRIDRINYNVSIISIIIFLTFVFSLFRGCSSY